MSIAEEKVNVNSLIRQVKSLDSVDLVQFHNELNQMVKHIGIADNAKGHKTSRTHFCGSIKAIEEIEKCIFAYSFAEIEKDNHNNQYFNIESNVKTKRINIILPAKFYSYPVWFRYDHRDNTATMEIKDKDIWLLCKINNSIFEGLSKLSRKRD